MKEIGLFYAMNAAKTSHIAEKIREKLGHKEVEMIMIEKAWQNDFQAYDNLIVGASTWFDGELPTYWDEMLEPRTLPKRTAANSVPPMPRRPCSTSSQRFFVAPMMFVGFTALSVEMRTNFSAP